MKTSVNPVGKNRRRVQIQKPTIQNSEEEKIWQEVRKYASLIPLEAEPNIGRVQEIKEEIRGGAYLTPEILAETAVRLAIRFMKKE